MIAIADEQSLFLLEFVDRLGLTREIECLRQKTKSAIIPGKSQPIISIEQELHDYFAGTLIDFDTPLSQLGSSFQRQVWQALLNIPYGETRSYQQQASTLGRPTACRAIANANGANQFAIVVPCHRVIKQDGQLGGYGGGVVRKKWLIEHEKKINEKMKDD